MLSTVMLRLMLPGYSRQQYCFFWFGYLVGHFSSASRLPDVTQAPLTQYNLLSNQLSNRFDNQVNVCIHDTTGCKTGCQTGCIVYTITNIQPTGCIVYTTGCQTGCTTQFDNRLNEQWLFIHHGWTNSCSFNTVVKLVWQPIWEPVVSCKRGIRVKQLDSCRLLIGSKVWPIEYRHFSWLLVTCNVNHLLQAFSNAILYSCAAIQQRHWCTICLRQVFVHKLLYYFQQLWCKSVNISLNRRSTKMHIMKQIKNISLNKAIVHRKLHP